MVCPHDIDRSVGESLPERILIRLLPQGRLPHVEASVRAVEPLPREVEIDRPRLNEEGQPPRTSGLRDPQSPLRGHVDRVHRRPRLLGHRHGPHHSDLLRQGGSGLGLIRDGRAPLRLELGRLIRQDARVLRVYHGQDAGVARRRDHLEEGRRVRVETPEVHEDLDARLARGRERPHLGGVRFRIVDRRVQDHLGDRLLRDQGRLPVDDFSEVRTPPRRREVRDRGDPTGEGRHRAGAVIVDPASAQMDVRVDAAGQDQQPRSVDAPDAGLGAEILPHRGNNTRPHQDVGLEAALRRHDGPAVHEQILRSETRMLAE